ncbi:MAG: serine hydrolase [Candidatus Hodarchaeales archaeon]
MVIQGNKRSLAALSILFLTLGLISLPSFVIKPTREASPFKNSYATLTGHARAVDTISFSPDDSLLASGSWDGTIRLWNVSNGAVTRVLRHNSNIFSVEFSPDGEILASSGWYELRNPSGSYDRYSRIKLWDVASGSLLQTLVGENQTFWEISFSPDGKTLAVGGLKDEYGFIKFWNVTSGEELNDITGHNEEVYSVDFSPDGTMISSGSGDSTTKLWDVNSGSLLHTFNQDDVILSVAFSPDGTLLASGGYSTAVQLWDVTSRSLFLDLTGQDYRVWSLTFSPDGSMLASGSGDRYVYPRLPMHETSIKLWDLNSGVEEDTLMGHTNVISSVTFSNDGTRLASASWDWTVKLWGNHEPLSLAPDDWPTSSPEEQGMDSTKLNALFDHIDNRVTSIHGLVIMRHGVIVAERYYSDQFHHYIQEDIHQLHSVTKSITTALIGMAIDKGYIESINQKIIDFFPEKNFSNVDSRKELMTLEHLLTMKTGLDWPEWEIGYDSPDDLADQMLACEDSVQFILDKPMVANPGTEFNYNSGASHLLSAIIQRVTGNTTLDFALENLFEPLGISSANVVWETDYQGIARGHSNLFLSPRSLAKFGNLFLNNGTWNGKQVISKEWIIASTTYKVSSSYQQYGYQWWILEEFGGYGAAGLDGHYIFILPEQDMVVAFTECEAAINLVIPFIIPAVITSTSEQLSITNSTSTGEVSGIPTFLTILVLIVVTVNKKRIKRD